MAPLRGAKRRKRHPEKALPAGVSAPMPPPDAADWWDSFSLRLAAGIHVPTPPSLSLSPFRLPCLDHCRCPSLPVPVPRPTARRGLAALGNARVRVSAAVLDQGRAADEFALLRARSFDGVA